MSYLDFYYFVFLLYYVSVSAFIIYILVRDHFTGCFQRDRVFNDPFDCMVWPYTFYSYYFSNDSRIYYIDGHEIEYYDDENVIRIGCEYVGYDDFIKKVHTVASSIGSQINFDEIDEDVELYDVEIMVHYTRFSMNDLLTVASKLHEHMDEEDEYSTCLQ